MTIYSLIAKQSFDEIEDLYKDKGYKEFKDDLGEIVYQELKPIQERYYELINSSELDSSFFEHEKSVITASESNMFL